MKLKNRKTLPTASVAGIIILAVGGGLLLIPPKKSDAAPQARSISTKQALALPRDGQCFANVATVKAQVQSQKGLGEEDGLWTSYIYDVPAGVNVDVSIASYNGSDEVTGSLKYPPEYGSYNFTVTKHAGEWSYAQFTGCN